MNRELLILRHGKSDWSQTLDDYQRPLKDRGKRGAQRIGVYLQQTERLPDFILSSAAERAKRTAEKCCKTIGLDARNIVCDQSLYMASPEGLFARLQQLPDMLRRVLIVGHNPGLEDLLLQLCQVPMSAYAKNGKLLTTATLAVLRIPVSWSQLGAGVATMQDFVRGRDLPEGFPYPHAGSAERRSRPAYYYSQSSVIPYRLNQGRLEILLISSSQKKHFVVPKGIADPGLTLAESAAKEAWEEAGVEGEVDKQALGQYRYEKWGATCAVTVYSMRVTKLLSTDEWEEEHRGRQWCSLEQAAGQLKQAHLKPLLQGLQQRLEKA